MTTEDAAFVLAVMKTAWPASYRGLTAKEANATVALWAEMFADEPRELVAAAVKAIILEESDREFAPTIGAVKQRVIKLREPEEMTAQEAWQCVTKAVTHCSLQDPSREFNKLPEAVQRAVGSPNQLRDWGLVDETVFHTVVASNFRKIWETSQKREQARKALPSELRQYIGSMARNMAMLPDGEQEEV